MLGVGSEDVAAMLDPAGTLHVSFMSRCEVPEVNTPRREPTHSYESFIAGWMHHPGGYPVKDDVLEAIREPENAYDRNAVALYLGGRQVGYVPRGDAFEIARHMDKGLSVEVVCLQARGNRKSGAPIRISVYKPADTDPRAQ